MSLRTRTKGILNEDYFKSVSNVIGGKWRVLGRHLSVKKTIIDRVERTCNNDSDKAVAVLKEWFLSMQLGDDGVRKK